MIHQCVGLKALSFKCLGLRAEGRFMVRIIKIKIRSCGIRYQQTLLGVNYSENATNA